MCIRDSYGMDIQTAIDFPRSFPENGCLKLEEGYSDTVVSELENKGHKILRPNQPIGGSQAIMYDLKKDIFSKLTRWQKVQLSRHPQRPYTLDYIKRRL